MKKCSRSRELYTMRSIKLYSSPPKIQILAIVKNEFNRPPRTSQIQYPGIPQCFSSSFVSTSCVWVSVPLCFLCKQQNLQSHLGKTVVESWKKYLWLRNDLCSNNSRSRQANIRYSVFRVLDLTSPVI